MVVICDISAWQYWRTPPVVREGWLDAALLDQMLSAASLDREILKPLRANAREAERLIRWRLLADLKGLSLPVHVMVDVRESRHASEILRVHEYPRNLPADMLVDLGNGLYVMPPELSASLGMRKTDVVTMAKRMFEACGLFSIIPSNPRIQLVLNDLLSRGVLAALSSRGDGIYGYSDSNGRRQGFLDQEGEALPWSPTFDRTARLTDMWKRAPLTSTDAIAASLDRLEGVRGLPMARRALALARDGAASPEEVRAYLLLCSGWRVGGESWGTPDLNRRVDFTPEARLLARRSFAVADCLWMEPKVDLEVQGMAFHADDQGFLVASGRRTALESMGYTVLEINHEQMADLEKFDAMLPSMARAVGYPLQPRTGAFLQRRDKLHRALFGLPYDPQ